MDFHNGAELGKYRKRGNQFDRGMEDASLRPKKQL